ncbi:MAG TPA: hypothetical protein VGF10_05380 [Gaiella sp.]
MPRIAPTLLASSLAALAVCAAATAGGPVLRAGSGCSPSCIEYALVTPTASSASVEIKTSAPASVTVETAPVDAELGLASGPAPHDVVVPPFLMLRTVSIPGLEPETTYRIVVHARDVQGHVETRSGTFTTRKVKVAVDLPDVGLSAGLACKADCLERGTLTSDPRVPGRAGLELRATVPVTFQVLLVARDSSGRLLDQRGVSTGAGRTSYSTTLDGLLTGTRYTVTAKATDADGHIRSEQGTFRTRSAEALVTVHAIRIVDDADKGSNAGEIDLDLVAQGDLFWGMGFRRIDSGTTFAPRMPGTTRPGVWTTVSVDGLAQLALQAGGVECDWQRLSRCPREAGSVGADWEASATTRVDLGDAFVSDDALPPGYGTVLPAGHDAYAIFETTDHSLKFRVYATVDVEVA